MTQRSDNTMLYSRLQNNGQYPGTAMTQRSDNTMLYSRLQNNGQYPGTAMTQRSDNTMLYSRLQNNGQYPGTAMTQRSDNTMLYSRLQNYGQYPGTAMTQRSDNTMLYSRLQNNGQYPGTAMTQRSDNTMLYSRLQNNGQYPGTAMTQRSDNTMLYSRLQNNGQYPGTAMTQRSDNTMLYSRLQNNGQYPGTAMTQRSDNTMLYSRLQNNGQYPGTAMTQRSDNTMLYSRLQNNGQYPVESSGEMKGLPDDRILRIFWMTGCPLFPRPRMGIAVCVVGSEKVGAFQSSRSQNGLCRHAEEELMQQLNIDLKSGTLEHKLRKSGTTKIEIFQNYSPCGACAKPISVFLGRLKKVYPNVTLHIHFVCIYKIFWNKKGPGPHFITPEEHTQNLEGLLHLEANGIQMQPFTSQTWANLSDIRMSDTNRSDYVAGDYPGWYGHHSREVADKKTAETFLRLFPSESPPIL
ncbi:uncharacterized protein LOC124288358 isoform X1 [Haliotis rubra]|uniref:uncharacterized protein LOC124288358 isoform X1 n=1 Tax=Haliotis rubra TaxID=36100 RepID=UPI001EE5DEC8|nr:uncharacterized protein LOC124288358 isoform X1 [Haliotis rubra]XP_046580820.1 uncharacterized protein LOC124288358 isoform X1 [Haliotis rubra]XP_046580821.1 uncharacterized protein LOC124288358 isoform X1 [Haliotis rubra]XP_046580822.1 uncharacterized protein LOC124288358 isoform X1 [Haliotis rubra]XP_046580823.1 uncharacterized protein LOC124288358 isoform X1 [Haliotis rubra]XP_046580824.1 uncharacterized protein LOC124288358 isoform X1 [Haliotis rubra]